MSVFVGSDGTHSRLNCSRVLEHDRGTGVGIVGSQKCVRRGQAISFELSSSWMAPLVAVPSSRRQPPGSLVRDSHASTWTHLF